ncbi:hypothetical protein N7527_010460 [Penicillium freii]|nr:hypothetical protein N7527_010460 [Penicillium freii]
MFLFFAVTGTSVQYRLLAQRMPTYQVIGVDNLRMSQPEAYLSITSMAVDLAAILRRQQPRRPYTLGGFSFGGLVPWVVAQYPEEQHGEAIRLILIDSEALVPAPIPPQVSTQDSQSAAAGQERRLTLVGWWQGTCAERGLLSCQPRRCAELSNARTKSAPSSEDCAIILGEADGILRKSHQFLQVWKPESESVCAVAILVDHFVSARHPGCKSKVRFSPAAVRFIIPNLPSHQNLRGKT